MNVSPLFVAKMERLRELGASELDIAHVWEKTGGSPDDMKIYSALREVNPEVAEEFLREMQLVVWRSDFKKEPFNRRRIVQSLLRETGISRGIAERIAKEVEEKVRGSGMRVVTSTLVRELVLARLIELGMEETYKKYMRLGIPVYDLEKILNKENVEEILLSRIFTQYVLTYVLPRGCADAVLDGVLRIRGIGMPHIPYARAYVSKTPNYDRWLSGLLSFLLEHRYVDIPSIYVPPHLYDDARPVVKALKNVVLWSDQPMDGVRKASQPLFSFGEVPARTVREFFELDLRRLSAIVSTRAEFMKYVEDIAAGIEIYDRFKSKYVRGGENVFRIQWSEDQPVEKERVLEALSPKGIVLG